MSENIIENKQLNFLKWVFIIVSIIHLVCVTVTGRGLYMDGSFFFVEQLNNLSRGIFNPSIDTGHARFIALIFAQIPLAFSYFVLGIKSKIILMYIFCLSQFLPPLLILLWNYNLTKRTKRLDVLFWSILAYGGILLLFSIFSLVELFMYGMLNFVLWNYLVADIDYTKKDKFFILFLLVTMFGIYEYTIFVGTLFFFASIYYAVKAEKIENKFVKLFIGIGSLFAAFFTLIFTLSVEGNGGEITRFLGEAIDFLPNILHLNTLFTVLALVILTGCFFVKKKLNSISICGIVVLFVLAFVSLIMTKSFSINPVLEGHMRSIPCWAFPLIYMGMFLFDVFSKTSFDRVKFQNYICVVLILGIFQTCWQMINTYYWDKNIKYMKNVLAKSESPLYIPSEHKPISSFSHKKFRRYIWHSVYAPTSIAFSDTYKQKTLLLHYDEPLEHDNLIFREKLYVPKNHPDFIAIPLSGGFIKVKNEFWDLSECAEALKKYNDENNIKTNE